MGIDIDLDRFVRDLVEPTQNHSRIVRSLRPHTFLRMASAIDGYSLENKGLGREPGFVARGTMLRPPFAPGRIGGALRLDGPDSGAHAVLPHYAPATDAALTVSVWVRADSRPRRASIAKNGNDEIGGQFQLGLFEDVGDLEVRIHDRHDQLVKVRERVPLPLHQWHHVAFVVDDTSLTLYRNGESVASTPCQGLTSLAPQALGVGVKLDGDGTVPSPSDPGFWHGRLDELAIFHQSLPREEIRSLYESASN